MDYFTSDTHFYHLNVIKYCNRPYTSVEQMNEELVQNWNSVVNDSDTVYHLGDVSIEPKDKKTLKQRKSLLVELLSSLRGKKVLVAGNHDELYGPTYKKLFHKVYPYLEIKPSKGVPHFVLFHYPIEGWAGRNSGSVHLHGHSHGNCKKSKNRYDVGVDCNNYVPLSLESLLVNVKAQKVES